MRVLLLACRKRGTCHGVPTEGIDRMIRIHDTARIAATLRYHARKTVGSSNSHSRYQPKR